MGLYVGEKKRLEAVERADFVELGHSMGLSRRATETRIDMLRDRVVVAFEAQSADSADSEIARAIACQSKSASISWPWYKGNASALVKLRRHVVRLRSSVSLVPGQCTRLLQLACAVHAPDMREHLARAHAVVIGGFSMTEALPVMRLIDARPARFAPLGRYSYVTVLPPSVFFSQMSASIVHSTIARSAFGRFSAIVS